MIDLISILVLGGIALFLNNKNDELKRENNRLRSVIINSILVDLKNIKDKCDDVIDCCNDVLKVGDK